MKNIPTPDILDAFGVSGKPVLLPGGEGTCYRVDNIVFKPTQNPIKTGWIAEINSKLENDAFRVPKPLRAQDGTWIFHGWIASEFLEGEHHPQNYVEAIKVSRTFHEAVQKIPKPDWFDQQTDVFALSDKMAWEELSLPNYEPAKDSFEKILSRLKKNRLPFQLIHGDWGPNQILFHDSLPPAVLDMTPYFRPANYSIADMLLCAIDHDGADVSVLDLGRDVKDFDQLLLRALVFRTCTYIGFQIHPENERDWTPTITRYLNLVDPVIERCG